MYTAVKERKAFRSLLASAASATWRAHCSMGLEGRLTAGAAESAASMLTLLSSAASCKQNIGDHGHRAGEGPDTILWIRHTSAFQRSRDQRCERPDTMTCLQHRHGYSRLQCWWVVCNVELTSCFSSRSSLLNAAAAAARRPLINIIFIAGGLQGAKGPPAWNTLLGRDWPAEGIAASATRPFA